MRSMLARRGRMLSKSESTDRTVLMDCKECPSITRQTHKHTIILYGHFRLHAFSLLKEIRDPKVKSTSFDAALICMLLYLGVWL